MKKFSKVCLILAAVLLVFGIGISAAAVAMGASLMDLPSIGFGYEGDGWDWSNYDEEWDVGEGESNQNFVEVKNLNIDMSGGFVQVLSGDAGEQIQVSIGSGDGGYECYQDGETLYIETRIKQNQRGFDHLHHGREIQILVPTGYLFDTVEVDVKAGEFIAEQLECGKLNMDVKAGSATVENGTVNNFAGECKAGEVIYQGVVNNVVEADCQVGSLEMKLLGKKEDFNYDIQVSVGEISLDNRDYSGMGKKHHIAHQTAQGTMDLECSAGAIEITFYESL
ncbi:MAG: hypothetical protein RSF83_04655 [Hungatella sp.]